MRRWLCALQIGALLSVLWCGVASADLTFSPVPIDLSARLFARCFGESTDRLASFSAVSGDPAAESPLRGLALVVDPQAPEVLGTPQLPIPSFSPTPAHSAFDAPVVNLSDSTYAPSSLHAPKLDDLVRVPVIGYYQNAAPSPTAAPSSHKFELTGWHVTDTVPAFSLSSGSSDAFDARGASVDETLQLGHVRFSPHAQAGFSEDAQQTQSSLNDRSLAAGATFDVRAGRRDLGLDLTSGIEHVTLAQPQFSTTASPTVGLTGEPLPVFVPAYADVNAKTISTGVTVPVTGSLTANVQYDTQHLLGGYGTTPGLNGLDANNTIYGAQLTFKLPKGLSAISLSAHQFHFQDNLLPSNAVTQTNANLNYTVKF